MESGRAGAKTTSDLVPKNKYVKVEKKRPWTHIGE